MERKHSKDAKSSKRKSARKAQQLSVQYKWCKVELNREQGNLLRSVAAGRPLEGISTLKAESEDELPNAASWPIVIFFLILLVPIIWSSSYNCLFVSSIPLLMALVSLGVMMLLKNLEQQDEALQSRAIIDDDVFAEDSLEEEDETAASTDADMSMSAGVRATRRSAAAAIPQNPTARCFGHRSQSRTHAANRLLTVPRAGSLAH
jgi:hypothetical protein